ncbi:hypothetical protein MPTK1_3g19660 [Marchantia polymorpha subsp. ruderalis]|uniref:DUF7796 domain-containing protein n=2 Tax=Marchantia polymorpha TaxID=3197 RepID=A0A176VRN3_MARPO|nr:hypothetical protein AXG93_4284s1180 [Marchantia polymorpha subsp. ruderalis]PTQ38779.1 hypothetical protein MARPO_0049s0068 [Marchantia polymorpha]BBN06264.1 hypothetical protein Mp_3g19660 [Marchantia polymorpha subsp. ruderalis]|eukprot:PTQ38779.1 hypothetical protein MARPO_0049s0068 [Marchantia polymorpha]
MGRGSGKFALGREKWITCFVFVILVGVVHWTASNSPYLASSINIFKGWSRQAILAYSTINEAERQNPENQWLDSGKVLEGSDESSPQLDGRKTTSPRVAICLVGGARAFELTGLTIKKYVLDVYDHPDIFLHVPFDENSHKLTVLQNSSHLVMARIFVPQHIPENRLQQEVLTGSNSPNGIQGLLQYFSLVEGCLDMISEHETKHKFKYDWIIRTRVDGYWTGPLPPVTTWDPKHYHVPYGSSFGGLNDRFGVGTRNTSWTALSRLSLIPQLHERGFRNLNSETSFRSQLTSSNVTVELGEFPFCILSARKYAWPPTRWGVPVASIKSKGNLNGAKCRPCHPAAIGDRAMDVLAGIDSGWGWIGPVHRGDIQLCDSTQDDEVGWEDVFDEVSGMELALIRRKITNRTVKECIRDVKVFAKSWEVWIAPSAEILCASHEK